MGLTTNFVNQCFAIYVFDMCVWFCCFKSLLLLLLVVVVFGCYHCVLLWLLFLCFLSWLHSYWACVYLIVVVGCLCMFLWWLWLMFLLCWLFVQCLCSLVLVFVLNVVGIILTCCFYLLILASFFSPVPTAMMMTADDGDGDNDDHDLPWRQQKDEFRLLPKIHVHQSAILSFYFIKLFHFLAHKLETFRGHLRLRCKFIIRAVCYAFSIIFSLLLDQLSWCAIWRSMHSNMAETLVTTTALVMRMGCNGWKVASLNL